MFYTYYQNNSGGKFKYDEKTGIGPNVIIEADNIDQANMLAKKIGLYFDGCRKGIDCHCCGDRWEEAEKKYTKPSRLPKVRGSDIGGGTYESLCRERYDTFIHYKDGSIEPRKHYNPNNRKKNA